MTSTIEAMKQALKLINKAIRQELPATVAVVDLHIAAGKLAEAIASVEPVAVIRKSTHDGGREKLIAELRNACGDIRRKPYPISDVIPIMQQAADMLAADDENMRIKQKAITDMWAVLSSAGHGPNGLDSPADSLRKMLAADGAQGESVTQSDKTWCEYVAGMIGAYLDEPVDSKRCKTIALIIERRLWAKGGAK